MKEDVLEQIVDDYLQFKGYFTTHNIRFRPDPGRDDYVPDLDRVSSDVDVVMASKHSTASRYVSLLIGAG
jgi:hypothetical protein